MSSVLGRLPMVGSVDVDRDHELELLEWQLKTTRRSSTNTFGTHPRRRRQQVCLMTLWSRRGLLDEGQNELTSRLLKDIDVRWEFNAFCLDRLTGGQNLATLCTYLFHEHGLVAHFRLDALVVWRFFSAVEAAYHSNNPYHNGVHAADVTQAMACFLAEPVIRRHLKPLELMAALIAAVGHDLDHPGLNEKFLIATSSHLAGLYRNSSVLENHHWRTAVAIMRETGFSKSLSTVDSIELENLIQSLVMATDISRQNEFLKQLSQCLDRQELDLSVTSCRQFMLHIALKCADISNPCRTWNISRLWSYRACEEFFRQGDWERELNIAVSPFCDRHNISVAKVQSTFYRYVAAPLFEEWHRSLNSPLSTVMIQNLTINQARWDLITQQEARLATMAESIVSTSSSSGGGGSLNCESRRNSLDHLPQSHHHLSRSSAEEDSDPCTSYPYMPLDNADSVRTDSTTSTLSSPRRHSLPPFSDPVLYSSQDHACLQQNRHYSLVDSAVHQLCLQNSELLANLRLAQKRRIFAANRSNPDSGSVETGDAAVARVTFQLEQHFDKAPNHQNVNLLCVKNRLVSRRGSAPCSLLLNQINKIASSAAKAVGVATATSTSREHSPRSLHHKGGTRRRGSLPSDLLSLDRSSRRSPSGRPNMVRGGGEKSSKKRKLLKHLSAGSSDGTEVKTPFNVRRGPMLGRKGSLKSMSVGSCTHSSGYMPSANGLPRTHVHRRRGSFPVNVCENKSSLPTVNKGRTLAKGRPDVVVLKAVQSENQLRTSLLATSFESKLLLSNNYNNGRRGSLPTELTLTYCVS